MEEEIVGEVDVGEELPKCILIEDLGNIQPTETSKYRQRYGIYECGFCGTHFKSYRGHINSGATKSCGCYHKSQTSKANKVHGGGGTKLYKVWKDIKGRITNKARKQYMDYGGRGITICDEWRNDFIAFRDWSLENGYKEGEGLSIDRIDVNGNYEPNNCRWTTRTIQSRNQRMKGNNTSGYRGVSFHKEKGKFISKIRVNKVDIYLGTFKTAVEGGIAYNNYIIENNLEGFNLNVIPTETEEIKND